MRYCDNCHRRHWVAKIGKDGLQVKHRNGNKVFLCVSCGNAQEEEPNQLLPTLKKLAANVLYIDIEVSKSEVLTYGRRVPGEYINHEDLVHEQYIICWAASYIGKSEVWSDCVTPKDALKWSDEKIVKRLHALIDAADVVAGHNVNQFDMKHCNTRFWKYGLPPITNKKTIDTLLIARQKFKLFSNSLDFIEKWLGFPGKDKIVNQDWLDALKGNEKTLAKILKYNKGDVIHGKNVLESMLPWSGKKFEFGSKTGIDFVDLKKPEGKSKVR